MNYIDIYRSPIGEIILTADSEGLTGTYFKDRKYFDLGQGDFKKSPALFADARYWLDIYFSGAVPGFMPRLHLIGTPFRLAVWRILCEIPYGHTTTYGAIAKRIAAERGVPRMSAQAVGGAVGHNPVGIIVPCHRVIGADGSLTGYAGGLDKKRALLAIEGL